jgi:hypothetical protein
VFPGPGQDVMKPVIPALDASAIWRSIVAGSLDS